MAVREGFEPSIGVAYTRVPGVRLKPLGHLTAGKPRTLSQITAVSMASHRFLIFFFGLFSHPD